MLISLVVHHWSRTSDARCRVYSDSVALSWIGVSCVSPVQKRKIHNHQAAVAIPVHLHSGRLSSQEGTQTLFDKITTRKEYWGSFVPFSLCNLIGNFPTPKRWILFVLSWESVGHL